MVLERNREANLPAVEIEEIKVRHKPKAKLPPTKAKCEQWDMLFPMLGSVLSELQILSKTKPNDALNAFKAKSVNKILAKVLTVLSDEATAEFLELLDE